MAERFRALKTGPLELALDGADLRYVRFAGTEILRRLYPAVRDVDWNTPAPTLEPPLVSGWEDRIEIRVEGRFEHGEIELDWTAEIEARATGTLRYRLRATATRDFAYNRLGLCVLQPLAGIVGQPCRWTGPEGDEQQGTLSTQIGPQRIAGGLPQPLIGPFSELEIDLAGLGPLRFRFEGALFELEDQRNWTDASYKTYGPPLALGFPLQAEAGQRFEQMVEIEPAWTPRPPAQEARPTVTLGAPVAALPPVGLAVPGDLSEEPHDRIRLWELSPAHLRIDLEPADVTTLARAEALARETGALLEVVLRLEECDELEDLGDALAALDPPPVRVLVLPRGLGATSPALAAAVEPSLRAALPGVPLVGGTASHLVALNCAPLELGTLDGVAYGIDPQVHASDEASIMETLEAQGDTVETARALAEGRPVSVGPISLRNRQLGADARQASSFCAAWTLGTVNALARAGAASITIFETTGPGSTGDARGRFPVHAALMALARRTGEPVLAAELADPLAITALATRPDKGTRILLANSRAEATPVSVAPLAAGLARVRDLLDVEATPYEFVVGNDGRLLVDLPAGGLFEIEHEPAIP
jgi:D-apionolactonase